MEKDEVLLNDWDAEVLNESINRTEKEAAREAGLAEGIELGEKQGETKERKNLIENMLKNGATIDFVSKVTSVPIKQLQKIKTNLFL